MLSPCGTCTHAAIIACMAHEWLAVQARNLVLYIWRTDVTQHLSLLAAQQHALVPPRLRPYAELAWRFLDTRGYINFGVAPAILAHAQQKLGEAAEAQRGTVAVIGAGLAGLGAAQQLRKLGHKVVVLEAQGRPGGRVHTVRLEVCCTCCRQHRCGRLYGAASLPRMVQDIPELMGKRTVCLHVRCLVLETLSCCGYRIQWHHWHSRHCRPEVLAGCCTCPRREDIDQSLVHHESKPLVVEERASSVHLLSS